MNHLRIKCSIVPLDKLRGPADDSLMARVEVALLDPDGVYVAGPSEDEIEFERR